MDISFNVRKFKNDDKTFLPDRPRSTAFNTCSGDSAYAERSTAIEGDKGPGLDYFLYRIALHEAGHALGLSNITGEWRYIVDGILPSWFDPFSREIYEASHPTVPDSVMNYGLGDGRIRAGLFPPPFRCTGHLRSIPDGAMTARLLIAALLLGLGLLGANSECDSEHEQISSGISLRDMGTVQWTPDGRTIVFSGGGKIVAVDAEGTHLWAIPQGPSASFPFLQDDSPRVSPDGARVVYRTYRYPVGLRRTHRFDLAVSDLDGSNHRKLTSSDGSFRDPAWSPDGSRIAYIKRASQLKPKDESHGIYIVASDGGDARRIGPPKDPRVGKYVLSWGTWSHAWSPDGEYIALFESPVTDELVRHSYVARVRLDGSDYQRIYTFTGQDFSLGPIRFSPDGQQLIFSVKADPDTDDSRGIRTVGLDGSGSLDLFTIPVSDEMKDAESTAWKHSGTQARFIDYVQWAKDGTEVIFSGLSQVLENPRTPENNGVHALRADGSGLRTMMEFDVTKAVEVWPISLSPDGSRVAVLRVPWDLLRNPGLGIRHPDDAWHPEKDGSVVLFTVSTDGTDKRVLVREVAGVFVAENRTR